MTGGESVAPARRILVVDDDDQIRGLLTRALERAGYEVVAAAEFEEGAALLERRQFALAIVDLELTGLHRLEGVELIEQARYRWPNLVLIVHSGHDDQRLRDECLRRGARAFVSKPTPLAELVALVDEVFAETTNRTGEP